MPGCSKMMSEMPPQNATQLHFKLKNTLMMKLRKPLSPHCFHNS